MPSQAKVLIYILRRDLRTTDNPVLHEIVQLKKKDSQDFTHLLPIFVFPPDQVEVSGLLRDQTKESPFPEARSYVGGFWRCGPHRLKFLVESLWDVKEQLQELESDLELRVGNLGDVVKDVVEQLKGDDGARATAVWMTAEEGTEEKQHERDAREAAELCEIDFNLWTDEKYLVDDRDLPFKNPEDLSDVFTSFRKTVEPLRDAPRQRLPRPERGSLLPLPERRLQQPPPFAIPESLDQLISDLRRPLGANPAFGLPNPPKSSQDIAAKSAHPFYGGEGQGQARVRHLLQSGAMTRYKDTRNGLVGKDFSTKLSAWLALGCITARWVHWEMADFEEGKIPSPLPYNTKDVQNSNNSLTNMQKAPGFGKGQSKGTEAVRFELLWRDYMRLCTRKFGSKLFSIKGFRGDPQYKSVEWKGPPSASNSQSDPNSISLLPAAHPLTRCLEGRTGTGLIDASARELFLTGYTSNRARQNYASFLAKHLRLDWRLGAEWYECMLIDYDVSSNWGNWCYVAGVGNDPRGEARKFNPVKQGVDYDPKGEYVKTWVGELSGAYGGGDLTKEQLMGVLQPWRLETQERERLGLNGVEWVEKPLVKIDFSVDRKGRQGGGGGEGRGKGPRGRGGNGWRGRGDKGRGRGRGAWRSGPMDKDREAE
ncbi:MAG: hypothetical protein M1820_007456 [Bogoriella megaspora]|nr:MAG: hypothetical protein M1820_007456 [Bogoriella megaspora]